jgi:DNA-binding XRE family transcriptional regulator
MGSSLKSQSSGRSSSLRFLRERSGYTRPQVRQFIGVSERRQADWESGDALPNLENAISLARLYQISLKEVCRVIGLDVSGVPPDEQ